MLRKIHYGKRKKKKTEGNPSLLSAIAGDAVLKPLQMVSRGPGRCCQSFKQHPCLVEYVERKMLKSDEDIGFFEKTKLDNAPKLKGTCYNDPHDIELKDTMQKAHTKSWKCQWNAPCLEKLLIGTERTAAHKTILEKQDVHLSLKPSTRRGRALGRLSAEITMHKPIPTLQPMKPPDAKAEVNKPITRYA